MAGEDGWWDVVGGAQGAGAALTPAATASLSTSSMFLVILSTVCARDKLLILDNDAHSPQNNLTV